MSAPSGFMLWGQFLHSLRSYSSTSQEELDSFLSQGQYEEAADLLLQDMGKPLFDERIEHDLRVEEPGAIAGAVRLLPELFPDLVLTTNLDDVLENTYEASEKRLIEILVGQEVERYRQLHSKGRSILMKLHGDCSRDAGRVLGVDEYNRAYASGGPASDSLALLYRTHPLLWLGCSLTLDRTVQLVGDVVGGDAKAPRHFAFLQAPDDDSDRALREKELTQRHIFPIWYEGDHDESIESLLVGILDSLGRFSPGGGQ